ncbi:hypothetical protein F3K20_38120 [Streptomyces scabiei]|nr:hypothetical protein [Streptomyces sp. LBUM 1484]MBP5871510.1 hypothetical protein [Streptomyces sp. LBUM 1485]MBP5879959.1 hypothetical protein [Streptomyces sp. LBUM 1477]MBP5887788.1 hypothetical protein [Streptomyces sp. LBUM 1487]MBP5903794.1 hypothetical protein [Streptomyces sp. LBUM 1488]QTU49859.1 hypothetical protein F3K20_38120 [Streptomyces sp. LBUM 1482]QTU58037.1 hypothetical protein F3K21_39065 [Streptomyces sp. LBUM 1480]QTU66075.1 hypothetical protein F3K22_38225 [Strepto
MAECRDVPVPAAVLLRRVEAHQGHAAASNVPGGCRFEVRLPAAVWGRGGTIGDGSKGADRPDSPGSQGCRGELRHPLREGDLRLPPQFLAETS